MHFVPLLVASLSLLLPTHFFDSKNENPLYNSFFSEEKTIVTSETQVKMEEVLGNTQREITIGVNNPKEIFTVQPNSAYNIVCKNYSNNSISFELFDVDNYNQRTPLTSASSNIAESSEKFISQIIINGDDRELIPEPEKYPFFSTGYLWTVYHNIKNNVTNQSETRCFSGTAFLLDNDLIVTAGHCLYGDVTSDMILDDGTIDSCYNDGKNNPRFADEIYFYPGLNGSDRFNNGTAVKYKVSEAYLENHYYAFLEKDWGCCRLEREVPYPAVPYGRIDEFYQDGYDIYSYGYPGSKHRHMYQSKGRLIYFESYNGWYFRTDMDVEGGQSGSPVFIIKDGYVYVMGILTYSSQGYNGGIWLDNFMYHFINSFAYREYNHHLGISLVGKQGSGWRVRIHNNTTNTIRVEYNSKMCFEGDAKNWTGLKDIKTIDLSSETEGTVTINENFFAGYITCSYVASSGLRRITYGTNLNKSNYTMTVGYVTQKA